MARKPAPHSWKPGYVEDDRDAIKRHLGATGALANAGFRFTFPQP
jgi:hypothetical protein